MKKLLILLIIPFLSFGQTYVPDDTFEQYLIDQGYDDVLDDYVLTENIITVATLSLLSLEIGDLTGIEDFTSLVDLDCRENNLSELDVSNNPQLATLRCGVNNLSELDVSNNTLLTVLSCNSNNLSELDISNNTELAILHCGENSLSELDISNNTLLTNIWCNNNWVLEELDVSNNTLLTGLQCQANNLSALDVSNNPDLSGLICNTNNLTELNLLNNAQLVTLDCSNNELEELNISNNTLLNGLQCQQNELLNCIQVWDVEYAQSNSSFYKDEDATWSLNCEYNSTINCDTVFIEIPTIEYVTDTLYIDNFITDTLVETEYVDVIVTEYIDCDSGLPCESGMAEIIEKSKTDGKIYNLLGQELFRREGIYIEGGEIKYRFQ